MLLREAFSILGVQPGIDVDEVRSRYRFLVKELHPDVYDGTGDELARIVEAYRLLDAKYYGGKRRVNTRPKTTEKRHTAAHQHRKQSTTTAGSRMPPNQEENRTSAEIVFYLGKIAVSDADRNRRCRALERLAAMGLRSAGVFIRQCIFDTDPVVAVAAAKAFPRVPGTRGESVLIELIDQLSLEQCVAIIDTIQRYRLGLHRFLAYAAADRRVSVRLKAMEVLRG